MVNPNEAILLGLGAVVILGSGVATTLIKRGEERIDKIGQNEDEAGEKNKSNPQGEQLDNDVQMETQPEAGLIPRAQVTLDNGGQDDDTGGDGSGGQGSRQPENNDGSGKKITVKNPGTVLLAKGRGKQTVRSEELGTSFTGSGQDSGFEFRVFNRRASQNYEGLRTDTFSNPLETASQRANRQATNVDVNEPTRNRGESKAVHEARVMAFRRTREDLKNFNTGTNTGNGRRIPTVNKGGETRATANQGPRVTKGQKEAEEERARRTLAAICPSCV